MIFSFYLLTFGVLAIFAVHRATAWMHARGWIRWKMRRGTSSGLGNAVLGAQLIFQPQIREVLEVRLDERAEAGESGDPPDPGAEGWGTPLAADDRRERGRVSAYSVEKGYGRIVSDEFYDVLLVQGTQVRLEPGLAIADALLEGTPVEYSRQIQSTPEGPVVVATNVVLLGSPNP
jgi:hypothetical protein